jgi:phosphotriesterase-related protein
MVSTYRGEVLPSDLGVTLMHEHVFIRTPELEQGFPGWSHWNDSAAMELARDRLRLLAGLGVRTIVDMTVPGLGRDARLVATAGDGVDINIIAATGYYTFDNLPGPFRLLGPGRLFPDAGQDMLEKMFIRDIEVGIQGTDVKAAVLKCCTDATGLTPDVEHVIRAVARAHHRTGVPIITHTDAVTQRGLDQQRVLRDEGVDLSNVVIGHSNETTDFDYLHGLIDAGSLLGWDRCGSSYKLDLESQVDTLARLCLSGLSDRIVLSHDRGCWNDWLPAEAQTESTSPWYFSYIHNELIPQLLGRGVSEDDVNQMLIGNPCRFFAARQS